MSDRPSPLERLIRNGRLSRRDLLRAAAALGLAGFAGAPAVRAQAPRTRFVGYPFALGVASGYPTPDGMTLWTRLAPAPLAPDGGIPRDEWVTVAWQVAHDEGFARIAHEGRVRAVGELAHSVRVDVDGLAPDRPWFYRFLAGDEASPVGRTRTAPAAGAAPARLRFATGSCQHFEQGYFNAWRGLVEDDPDLVVFLGDYIYESSWGDDLVRRHQGGECYTLDDYRVRHAQYRTDPDLQRAHAAVPWLLTWDDHEVDNDPAAAESEHGDPRFLLRRAAAWQAYWEHMPLPARMRPRTDGSMAIHSRVDWGALASFFVLDSRQFRDAMACPDPFKGGGSTTVDVEACAALADPHRSLLGADQERWLLDGLAASTARWNLLAQQTRFSPVDGADAPGRQVWTDAWDGYPASREKVMAALERPGLGNPVVLGGDIHAWEISDVRRDPWNGSPVLAAEVCGTSVSSQGWPAGHHQAMQARNPHMHYGRSDRRGYTLLTLERDAEVRLRSPRTVKEADDAVETLARFVIEDGVRGIRPA